MWFSTFIFRNISRRPLRSLLTVFAIAIAIGSVVAFVGIANGFERTFLQLYANAEVDILVLRAGSGERGKMTLREEMGKDLREISGVKHVLPALMDMIDFAHLGVDQALLNGFIPKSAIFNHMEMLKGDELEPGDTYEVIIGPILANNINKTVGDKLTIYGKEFTIKGIYEAHNRFENAGMVIPLKVLQERTDRKGVVTGFSLILDKPNDPELVARVRRDVESKWKNISALSVREHVKSLEEINLAKSMSWITSAIALVIGFFGILNTMVMSVSERTREIGILRAVGWKVSRVIRMVLIESVFLSILGALAGTLGAIGLLRLLTHMPRVNGFIDGHIDPVLIAYGFLIAIGVGLLAGLFPANRAARMLPTEALRHE